ncbi:MAG: hypothetical protein JOZ55_09385, partial [Alphaproteobacteria bacterium]|nr:hypothetical protein [Alphaproteobacteria bacterium]
FSEDGWSPGRRTELRNRVLGQIDNALPGFSARIAGEKLILPPDIEEMIGRTQGDLSGGEIAPDQMLATRPWSSESLHAPRTAIRGLYLAGPSTNAGLLASGASGAAAAEAVITDKRGWL